MSKTVKNCQKSEKCPKILTLKSQVTMRTFHNRASTRKLLFRQIYSTWLQSLLTAPLLYFYFFLPLSLLSRRTISRLTADSARTRCFIIEFAAWPWEGWWWWNISRCFLLSFFVSDALMCVDFYAFFDRVNFSFTFDFKYLYFQSLIFFKKFLNNFSLLRNVKN